MSLKKEGTHNYDLKINSRRQSILVLGSTPCWWSHLFEWALATVFLDDFEVWQSGALPAEGWTCSQMKTPLTTVMTRLGQDCPGLSPCWSVCLCLPVLSVFLEWYRTTPPSIRETHQWVFHPTQARPIPGAWRFLRIIQTNVRCRGPGSKANTKPLINITFKRQEPWRGDDHTNGFHHASVRALGSKDRGWNVEKYKDQQHRVTRRCQINVWFFPEVRSVLLVIFMCGLFRTIWV